MVNNKRQCSACNKNETARRTLTDGICSECREKQVQVDLSDAPANFDDTLGDIKFGDFANWMTTVLVKCFKNLYAQENADIKKSLKDTKTELEATKKELSKTKSDLESAKKNISDLNKKHDNVLKCCQDNLKYLINHDRNFRRKNVILFGLPELVKIF